MECVSGSYMEFVSISKNVFRFHGNTFGGDGSNIFVSEGNTTLGTLLTTTQTFANLLLFFFITLGLKLSDTQVYEP